MSKLLLTLALTLLLATPALAQEASVDFDPTQYATVTQDGATAPVTTETANTATPTESSSVPLQTSAPTQTVTPQSHGGAVTDEPVSPVMHGTWGNPGAHVEPTYTETTTTQPNVPPFSDVQITPAQSTNNQMHGSFIDDAKNFFGISSFSYGDNATTTNAIQSNTPVKIKTTPGAKTTLKALPVRKTQHQLTEVGPAENMAIALVIALISTALWHRRSTLRVCHNKSLN